MGIPPGPKWLTPINHFSLEDHLRGLTSPFVELHVSHEILPFTSWSFWPGDRCRIFSMFACLVASMDCSTKVWSFCALSMALWPRLSSTAWLSRGCTPCSLWFMCVIACGCVGRMSENRAYTDCNFNWGQRWPAMFWGSMFDPHTVPFHSTSQLSFAWNTNVIQQRKWNLVLLVLLYILQVGSWHFCYWPNTWTVWTTPGVQLKPPKHRWKWPWRQLSKHHETSIVCQSDTDSNWNRCHDFSSELQSTVYIGYIYPLTSFNILYVNLSNQFHATGITPRSGSVSRGGHPCTSFNRL